MYAKPTGWYLRAMARTLQPFGTWDCWEAGRAGDAGRAAARCRASRGTRGRVAHQLLACDWSKVYVAPAESVSVGLTPAQPVIS
eukprot:scaffold35799_cov80-Phaeocystis_antarctica.AAC.2